MQTNLSTKEGTKAKFSVTVPAEDVNNAYRVILSNVARQVKVPGFRPGKAPRGILEAKVGKEALAQEVRDALVETYYPRAVKELELSPIHAHFDAEEPHEGEEFSFEVEVDLYPEIQLPDLKEIVIDTASETVTDDMIAQAAESLRNDHATQVPVDRPVEAADVVMVESVTEGDAEGSVMPIDLERVAPDFAEQLLGKSIGDDVTLQLSSETEVEDDENAESEAEAVEAPPSLKVVIRDVKAKEKPALDDEFAKTLGFDAWAGAHDALRDNLQAQLDQEAQQAQREEFVEKLVTEVEVELPESLVDRRKAQLLHDLEHDLGQRGMNLEQYLEGLEQEGKRDDFEKELLETAEQGVKRDLVLERHLEHRGTTLSEDEFGSALQYMAQRKRLDLSSFKREMGENWLSNYRYLLTRDKAVRESVAELLGTGEAELTESDTDA